MRAPRRLDAHPLTRLERGSPLRFHHEGQLVAAYEGETVAAALYAQGGFPLSRSMRYHRGRGLFCSTGACTHCFLRINGVPNQRACLTPCESTTWSEGQNALPNVRHDLLGASDWFFPRYLDAHKSFLRPAFLRPAFLRIIRAMAGFGRVPRQPLGQRFRRERLDPELLIVGGGPAGLAAAEVASSLGARVALAEAEEKLGGRLRHLPTPFHAAQNEHAPSTEGKQYAEEAETGLRETRVDLRLNTRVFGVYGATWTAATPTTLLELHPQRVLLAPGALDAYEAFPGSDRNGVLLATAASKLLNVHGIVPADPIVIYGATREGLLLARDLVACGAQVAGVYDPRPQSPAPKTLVEDVRRLGIAVQVGHQAASISGRTRPRAVVFETSHGRVRIACATFVVATRRIVLSELFQQAGAQLQWEPRRGGFLPVVGRSFETTVHGLYAAGSASGIEDEWASVLRGRIAGAAAALSLEPNDAKRQHALERAWDAYTPVPPAPTTEMTTP